MPKNSGARQGKSSIDHPRGGPDDFANALALSVYAALHAAIPASARTYPRSASGPADHDVPRGAHWNRGRASNRIQDDGGLRMKKMTPEEIVAAREGLVKLGLIRQVGVRKGQPVWGLVSPDDFRCPACGGDWTGTQDRSCQSCSEVASLRQST